MVIYYDNLYERIIAVYPDLPQSEFFMNIKIRNDGDGDYIQQWNCVSHVEPTEAQLRAAI